MSELVVEFSRKQTTAYQNLTSDENIDLCYGGAKGGGKSWLMCVWAYIWTSKLIELFGLKPSNTPVPVGFLGRSRGVDFQRTTLETWKREIPQQLYTIKGGDREIILGGGAAKLFYGGLDNQEDIAKFNSAELAFFGVDQAEETQQEDISVLEASLRLKVNGIAPPYKALYTANPRKCWLKNRYLKAPRASSKFVRALPSDNPHLPSDYEETLRRAFGHNPALLAAYLYGEWDVFEGMFFEEFNRCYHVFGRETVLQPSWPTFISVDWGYASPMAVYWHKVGPDRHVYTYREWYKTRQLDVDAAAAVNEITKKAGEKIEYAVGDPQSFPMEIAHFKFGKTVSMKRSEVWSEQGVPLLMGDSNRVAGWSRMRQYMAIRDYQGTKSSWWHISEDCTNLIDELTTAVHDKHKVEDVSGDSVDHGLESCRLFLMSRPPIISMQDAKSLTHLEAAERQYERNRENEPRRIGEDYATF